MPTHVILTLVKTVACVLPQEDAPAPDSWGTTVKHEIYVSTHPQIHVKMALHVQMGEIALVLLGFSEKRVQDQVNVSPRQHGLMEPLLWLHLVSLSSTGTMVDHKLAVKLMNPVLSTLGS